MTKRYFEMDDGGVEYLVVASDLEHAQSIIRGAGLEFGEDGMPYDAAIAAGLLTWSEAASDRIARTNVCTNEPDGPYKVPLTECALGDWFCSEW